MPIFPEPITPAYLDHETRWYALIAKATTLTKGLTPAEIAELNQLRPHVLKRRIEHDSQ